jgi:hypothetical protein
VNLEKRTFYTKVAGQNCGAGFYKGYPGAARRCGELGERSRNGRAALPSRRASW